ncbi:MAG: PEP-CTERM sorting domain-containing protein [Planctomycetota bacterium]
MNKYSVVILVVVVLSAATMANASMLDQVVDGRSLYQDVRAWGGSVHQTADQTADSTLVGTLSDGGWGDKTIGCPVLEFETDGSVSGQGSTRAILHLYLTQPGSDSSGGGITLSYGQGNGSIEYGDTGGTAIASVDPAVAGWQSIDVSQAVQAAEDGNWPWLRLTLTPEQSGDQIYVASVENVGFEPFVAIPEPATTALVALSGLAMIRRRKV